MSTGTIGPSQHGVIANITVTYDVTPQVQLYANGRNIFDSRFEPVNGYQTPGPIFLRRRAATAVMPASFGWECAPRCFLPCVF